MADEVEVQEPLKSPEQVEAEKTDKEELARLAKAATDGELDDVSKEDMAKALLKLNDSNTQLHARLLKAKEKKDADKAAADAAKAATKPNETNKEAVDVNDIVDLRLLQRDGATEEDIAKLRIIQAGAKAMGKNISLVEAQQDELYKAYEDKKKSEDKRAKAQLTPNGSTRSAAQEKVQKMTDEQHAAYAKEKAEEVRRNMGLG